VAISSRWKRRPMPGQPLAKVENSRCKNHPLWHRKGFATGSKPLKVGPSYPTFGGSIAR
jgi:hypothetical protein